MACQAVPQRAPLAANQHLLNADCIISGRDVVSICQSQSPQKHQKITHYKSKSKERNTNEHPHNFAAQWEYYHESRNEQAHGACIIMYLNGAISVGWKVMQLVLNWNLVYSK